MLVASLPEFKHKTSASEITARVEHKNHTLRVAVVEGMPVGFIVCYPDGGAWYNWIMGVLPAYRRYGVGRALMDVFISSGRDKGFNRLRVKSMNAYRSMLKLLIDFDFNIVDVVNDKIVFEKAIDLRCD